MSDPREVGAWLRLTAAPGLGRAKARRLLAAFGSAPAVMEASEAALAQVAGPAAAALLVAPPDDFQQQLLADTLAWLDKGAGRTLVMLGDAAYPQALLHAADPPLMLYAHGRLELLQRPSVAIVGSRNPTAQGTDNARAFGVALSNAGWTVVSGLALGIDGAAHQGALAGPGSTIGVVGTGLDRIYPSQHKALTHRIAQEGLLLSEFALGAPPLAEHFPMRNRIIAGLSRGTLVVEAALRSGSLITARMALEAGRDVFAIPGSIHATQSRGCHALLKQGAKLVEQAQDVLEELAGLTPLPGLAADPPDPQDDDGVPPPEDLDPVLAALGHDPATLDALIARCGWPAPALNARLLELELDGQVVRLPGGLFQRRSHA